MNKNNWNCCCSGNNNWGWGKNHCGYEKNNHCEEKKQDNKFYCCCFESEKKQEKHGCEKDFSKYEQNNCECCMNNDYNYGYKDNYNQYGNNYSQSWY